MARAPETPEDGRGQRFVLTGGAGFVGRRLVDHLRDRYSSAVITVLGSETDLTDWPAASARFKDIAATGGCDHLIHLAAYLKPSGWLAEHPATTYRINTLINLNVFEARRLWLRDAKLTSISSYAVYSSGEEPHVEAEALLGAPEDGLFAYAHAKRGLLIAQKAYELEHDLNSASVVLPTVYGPRPGAAEDAHVIGALTGKFLRAMRNGDDTVTLWGDGEQVRDFLHIDDAVSGIVLAAERQTSPLINLGSGDVVKIAALARLIAAEVGFQGRLAFDADRYAGEPVRRLNVALAERELGWTAQIPLAEGVGAFVKWMRAEVQAGRETLD